MYAPVLSRRPRATRASSASGSGAPEHPIARAIVACAHERALAEDIGFIGQLGAWVLEEACRQVVCWEAAGLHVPKIAVNLSGRQFDRGSVAPLVARVLADTGLAPQRLQLEVTESVIMNTGDALQYINDLHALGVEPDEAVAVLERYREKSGMIYNG